MCNRTKPMYFYTSYLIPPTFFSQAIDQSRIKVRRRKCLPRSSLTSPPGYKKLQGTADTRLPATRERSKNLFLPCFSIESGAFCTAVVVLFIIIHTSVCTSKHLVLFVFFLSCANVKLPQDLVDDQFCVVVDARRYHRVSQLQKQTNDEETERNRNTFVAVFLPLKSTV